MPSSYADWSLEELEGVKPPGVSDLPPNWQSRTQAEISASNAPYFRAQGEIRRREQLKKAIEKGPYANIPGFGEVFSLPSGMSGTSKYVDASGNSIPKELTSEWGRGRHGELYIPKEYKTQRPPTDPGEWGTDLGPNDRPFPSDPTIDDLWPGGCPSPKERIQLANNDWILAGELKVGDEVATSEDPQKVTRVQRLENRARCEVLFEDSDSIVTSYSHPYFVNSKGFVEVGNLKKGDIIGDLVVKGKKPFAMGPVISLSVDKAETYMLRGGTKENPVPVLSHNKSLPEEPWPPVTEPQPPMPPTTPTTPTPPTTPNLPVTTTPTTPQRPERKPVWSILNSTQGHWRWLHEPLLANARIGYWSQPVFRRLAVFHASPKTYVWRLWRLRRHGWHGRLWRLRRHG